MNARLILAAAIFGITSSAFAAPITIDFNSYQYNNTNVDNRPGTTTTYTEDGFLIKTPSLSLSIAGTQSTDWAGSSAGHLRSSNGLIELVRANNGLFNLDSIDLSFLHKNGSSPAVQFKAYNASNVLVSTASFLPTTFGFKTFNFSNSFDGVSKVTWNQGSNETSAHQFDNIRIDMNQVPEPGTMALMGLAAIGFGASRMRASARKG